MDIRGVEVTNRLRNAIRMKLLELGVRYDEELPDYILVMVVNKKSRQQMHEDLHLFLEDSTTPFVEWLHDQVLKKLQKITIAKKKSREFVPTVVVKQEEERRKKKASQEDEHPSVDASTKVPKEEKAPSQTSKPTSEEIVEPRVSEKPKSVESRLESGTEETSKSGPEPDPSRNANREGIEDSESRKSSVEAPVVEDKKSKSTKRSVDPDEKDSSAEEEEDRNKKLRSSVNKPKITSVVSVKNRLGIVSPRKKFEVHWDRNNYGHGYRADRRTEFPNWKNSNFHHRRTFEDEEGSKRSRESEKPTSEFKSRVGFNKDEKKPPESKDKSRAKAIEKVGSTIKDRLGHSEASKDIKRRLGPIKNQFRPIESTNNSSKGKVEDSSLPSDEELDEDSKSALKSRIIAVNKPSSLSIPSSVAIEKKSRVPSKEKPEESGRSEELELQEEGKLASKVIVTPRPLKPLQPAQKRATQSLLLRAVAEANQSVVTQKNPEPILRDKKPVLKRLKPSRTRDVGQNLSVHLNASKRLVMEKIQVELTNTEAHNEDLENDNDQSYVSESMADEQMGVVMSLFQRSDDNQKFLVTLNGYNNNVTNEKNISDDEEQLEMEVNEDDELVLSTTQNESVTENESDNNVYHETEAEENLITEETDNEKKTTEENNENYNIENVVESNSVVEEVPKKRRKLSPIVYNRSPTPNQSERRPSMVLEDLVSIKHIEKRPVSVTSTVVLPDKSKEKCRYWPNCTLGNKCAFYHPALHCSSFPACKFGEKCAYKHPKCKFGLSCTKLGCIFSHPAQQCKYHPFCTKPGCPYSHPPKIATVTAAATTAIAANALPLEGSNQRAKFTWRRRD